MFNHVPVTLSLWSQLTFQIFWLELSVAISVCVNFKFLQIGSFRCCQRNNMLEYMWTRRKDRKQDKQKNRDYKKEVYLLLSAQIISERLCQFCTDAKCLLSVMQYWKMKRHDMIVVWSDAGEFFQMHCASIYVWCFNAFLHWWEFHWSSQTSLLLVTSCLITLEKRRILVFATVIGNTSDCF